MLNAENTSVDISELANGIYMATFIYQNREAIRRVSRIA
jgi:hypothetical protein